MIERRTPLHRVPFRRKARARRQRAGELTPRQVRAIIWERSYGRCECCGKPMRTDVPDWHPDKMDASHRVGEGQGGRWVPSNVCALRHWCHLYGAASPHRTPLAARERGLALLSTEDPTTEPVLLWTGNWVLLDDEGGYRPSEPRRV